MANTIKIKNSGTANSSPSSLDYGELAINYQDGKLFYKNGSNTIVPFTLTAGTGAKITTSDTPPSNPASGDLWYESDSGKTFIYYDSFWVEISGATGPAGAGGALGYYGSFYDTRTQTVAVTGAVMTMGINQTGEANGMYISNDRIYVSTAGVYNIQFSAQFHCTSSSAQINIWLARNGTKVAYTNTRVDIVANNPYQVSAWNFLLTLNAGDYIELKWISNSTNIQIESIAAGSDTPYTPSVILTLQQVMNLQTGNGTAELLGGTTLNANITGSSLTSVGTLTSFRLNGPANLGSNTYAKNLNSGDIGFDNGTSDTPGVLFYNANNTNWGIDSESGNLRFVKNLNEAGGSVKAYLDANGNMSAYSFRGTSAGSVLKDTILSNSEVTISSTTIATSTTSTDFITYNYTPVSSSSYLIVHIHIAEYSTGAGASGDDSYFSQIKVDGSEISYSSQKAVQGSSGQSFRTGVLFPLTGRYTNSSTTAKQIQIAAKRNSADDNIVIVNTSSSIWLRITEVAR